MQPDPSLPLVEVPPPPLDPMGVRVRRQRRRLGLTLDELAARAGMSKPYLSLIETGRVGNPPSDEKLRRLEQELALPSGELLGQAHWQRTPPAVRGLVAELLRAAGELPPAIDGDPLTAALLRLIGRAGNNLDSLSATVAPALKTGGGDVTAVPFGSADGFVGCPGLGDPDAFAAGVSGDAMSPRFNDGDVVVFSPAADVRPGDDCFVQLTDGRTTLRRVFPESSDDSADVVRLQPRNERYRPLVVAPDQVAGTYRAVFRYERLAAATTA